MKSNSINNSPKKPTSNSVQVSWIMIGAASFSLLLGFIFTSEPGFEGIGVLLQGFAALLALMAGAVRWFTRRGTW